MYFSLNHIMSYNNYFTYIIIGARGIGKTFSIKKHLIKDFLYKQKKFVVLRDTDDDCDKLCKNNGDTFFSDIMLNVKDFKQKIKSIIVKEKTIYINGKLAGYVMPLSLFYKYKGNAYPDVFNIYWDEFIPEHCQRYIGDRVRQFVNTIQTIGRTRTNYRIFLTANALDKGNEVLELFKFNITNFGIYKNKKKGAILYYAPNNPEFDKATNDSIAGKIISGTQYDQSINQNKFENNTIVLIDKRKKCDIIGIYYNEIGDCFRLYEAKDGSEYYVCKDINSKSLNYMRYVFNYEQVDENHIYADVEIKNFLKLIFESRLVKFQSNYLAKIYLSIIDKKRS